MLSLSGWGYAGIILLLFLIGVLIRDILQRQHTIQHNFPIVGHIRYFLESFGPELRQYIVANNREELPFNREQRSWIYASAKKENNYTSFGTDQDIHQPGFIFVKPALFPYRLTDSHFSAKNPTVCPSAKVIGPHRQKPYLPPSIVNISAMSYGSLSSAAVSAINMGSKIVGNFQNTGEGGLSKYHQLGGDLVFNIGTGYFGVRDEQGNFSLEKLVELVANNPSVKMIELKLSQGAKPGKGGVLPGAKITPEIAEIRGVPMGKDVVSPPYHSAFATIPEMLDFIELMANATGLPVGIKAAVGKLDMWEELALEMKKTGKGPDFIAIDGGEGGTGAAPRSFSDHVALPWVYAFSSVYKLFQQHGMEQNITWMGAGKLGFPEQGVMALAMGVDVIYIAREALMSIGCIQAQRCHTNKCPVGITTNNKWLVSGLDPELKSVRFANYMKTFMKEMLEISHACGYEHPSQFTMDDVNVSMGDNNHTVPISKVYGYQKTPVKFRGFEWKGEK